MTIPAYSNGKPTNLQAAMLDVEYWLRAARHELNAHRPQRARAAISVMVSVGLCRAIQALEEYLPNGELASDGSTLTDLPLS